MPYYTPAECTLSQSLSNNKNHWVRVSRPTEGAKNVSVDGAKLQTVAYALGVVLSISLLTLFFAYEQPKENTGQAVASSNIEKAVQVTPVAKPTPTATPNPTPTSIPVQTHIVQPDENLWKIARHFYGNGSYWKKLIVKKKTSTLRPGDIVEIPQE
ncbi:MAG: LysM peptidoglycan-binding domain-containing protein [Candidatus Levyibacteriota bacterium]